MPSATARSVYYCGKRVPTPKLSGLAQSTDYPRHAFDHVLAESRDEVLEILVATLESKEVWDESEKIFTYIDFICFFPSLRPI